jgi:GDP-4-dehydro-6-deoxy-D-mannose reductase
MMGSHLAERLLSEKSDVLATYFKPTIDMSTVDQDVKFSELDVCDREAVFSFISEHQPDEIYHLAAQSLPTVSWLDPWLTCRVNVEGTINIFEAILAVRRFNAAYDPMTVIACSSAEYGASLTPERVPVSETAPLLPLHPYGVSKVAQDLLGHQYSYNHNLRCIRARIFNCTGPRKRNDVVSDFGRAVVRSLRQGVPVSHGNLLTRRAIIDVRDMIEALISLARKGHAGEAYNICADKAFQISEVLEMYFDIIGRRLPAQEDPKLLRLSDEPIIFGDTTKIRADTGWSPTIPLRQTLADVIDYEEKQFARHG